MKSSSARVCQYVLQSGVYHCVFLRTRLVISVGGFFTTIHIIIDVARQRLYLDWCQQGSTTRWKRSRFVYEGLGVQATLGWGGR